MSNVAFRDLSVVVIDTSRTTVRAVQGLHELLPLPSLEIKARVGLRRSAYHEANGTATANGVAQPSASTSRATSSAPHASAKVNDYLVGAQLDDALAVDGRDIVVSWPFAGGDISDWTQAEAIWKHILFTQLSLRRTQNESPVLLTLPTGLPRSSYERVSQIFFERFNVAAFAILDRPLAQIFAAGALSGIIVDIGDNATDITPIYDGYILHNATASVPLGVADCRQHLARLLKLNQSVMSVVHPPESLDPPVSDEENLLELVDHLLALGLIKPPTLASSTNNVLNALTEPEDGVTDIAAIVIAGKEKAVIENNLKKKLSQKQSAAEQAKMREIEAMDLVTVEWKGQEVVVGKERHRFCEPLFDPGVLTKDGGKWGKQKQKKEKEDVLPVQDMIGFAARRTEVDQRQYIWGGLFVTGELTKHVRGVGTALQSRLTPYILSAPDALNEVQPRHIRILKTPEYFAEYREKGDGLASFLGACIVAKITFHDPNAKNFVSKGEYAVKGPRAIIEMSPSLL